MNKTKSIFKLIILSWGIFLGLNTHAYDVVEVHQETVGQIYYYDVQVTVNSNDIAFSDSCDEITDIHSQYIAHFKISSKLTWSVCTLAHVYEDELIFAFS